MNSRYCYKPLTLCLFLLLSPFVSYAEGGVKALGFLLPFMIGAFVLLVAGIILSIVNSFSKSKVAGVLSILVSSVLMFFAFIFITWGLDFFFLNAFLYIALIGFIVYLYKANKKENKVLTSGILLGMFLLLIRLAVYDLTLPVGIILSAIITAVVTGAFIVSFHRKRAVPENLAFNARQLNEGLKVSLISAAFYFFTSFYYVAAKYNFNDWFSFRESLYPSHVLIEFREMVTFFCITFVAVFVAGMVTTWGVQRLNGARSI